MELADRHAGGRIVGLEGGHDLTGLPTGPAMWRADGGLSERTRGTDDRLRSPQSRTSSKALEELETIVQRLEQGEVELEESITIYERGELLKKHCERLLKEAEGRVEKIRLGGEGKPEALQPLDDDDPF